MTWPVTARRTALAFCLPVGVLFAGDLLLLAAYAAYPNHLHGDFFAFWSYGQIAATHAVAAIYDPAAVQGYLLSLDPAYTFPAPYFYPPSFLLLLLPLGVLPYRVAEGVWLILTLALYCAAVRQGAQRASALALVMVAPATMVNFMYGQGGFLTAGLLIGGLLLAQPRPMLAGALLGLLSFKPQFGLLILVAVLSARLWRAAAAAVIATTALVISSAFAFGAATWLAWPSSLPAAWTHQETHRRELGRLATTVFWNLSDLGLGHVIASVAQAASTFGAVMAVWWAFRRGPTLLAVAALTAATPLAMPYLLVYDLPLTAAAAAFVITERQAADGAFSTWELLVLGAAVLLPAGMFLDLLPPIAAAVHLLLLWLILSRMRALVPSSV